jgi:hypothetical protein
MTFYLLLGAPATNTIWLLSLGKERKGVQLELLVLVVKGKTSKPVSSRVHPRML